MDRYFSNTAIRFNPIIFMMNNDLAIQGKQIQLNPYKQMTLALPIETDRQNLLRLRHSSLVRDDSEHQVYRDEEEREYHSVTSILNILLLRNKKQH